MYLLGEDNKEACRLGNLQSITRLFIRYLRECSVTRAICINVENATTTATTTTTTAGTYKQHGWNFQLAAILRYAAVFNKDSTRARAPLYSQLRSSYD